MAAHSNILAWKIPWTEEPGRLLTVHKIAKESDTTEKMSTRTQKPRKGPDIPPSFDSSERSPEKKVGNGDSVHPKIPYHFLPPKLCPDAQTLPHPISKNKLTSQRKSWFINRHSPLPSICQLVKAGISYMTDDQTVMDISTKFISVCHVLLSKENNYFKTYIYVAKQNWEKNYILSRQSTFQCS